MDKKQETINTYDKNAKHIGGKFSAMGDQVRLDDIQKAFSYIKKANPKVVELGCGNGRDAKEILKLTNDYLGTDAAEGMLEIARQYVPEGKFIQAFHENFEFPQEIDIIFAFASLQFLNKEEFKQVLQKAHSALNPGGIIYLSLKYGEHAPQTKSDEYGVRHFYSYTPEEIVEMAGDQFSASDLEYEDIRGQKWFDIILHKR